MTLEYQTQDVRSPAQWAKYRDHVAALMLDERLCTLAGRLFFLKRLTPAQFKAATDWGMMLDDYDLMILGKRRGTKPPAYERSSPGESSEASPESIEEFLRRFNAARRALLVAGKIAEVAVNRVCRDEGVGAFFDDMSRGLDALAAHWGLTGTNRNASRDK